MPVDLCSWEGGGARSQNGLLTVLFFCLSAYMLPLSAYMLPLSSVVEWAPLPLRWIARVPGYLNFLRARRAY
jgi:hypothetical protein